MAMFDYDESDYWAAQEAEADARRLADAEHDLFVALAIEQEQANEAFRAKSRGWFRQQEARRGG